MNKQDIGSDLAKVDAHEITAEEYDEIPELDDHFFESATYAVNGVPMPMPPKRGRPKSERTKIAVKLRLDPDVLEAFKATGPGWQTRINTALRKAVGEPDVSPHASGVSPGS